MTLVLPQGLLAVPVPGPLAHLESLPTRAGFWDVSGWSAVTIVATATLTTTFGANLLVWWYDHPPLGQPILATITDVFTLAPGMPITVTVPTRTPYMAVAAFSPLSEAGPLLQVAMVRPSAQAVAGPTVALANPTLPLLDNAAGTVLGPNATVTLEATQAWVGGAHAWARSTAVGSIVDLFGTGTTGSSSMRIATLLDATTPAGTSANQAITIPPVRLTAQLTAPAAGATIYISIVPDLSG